MFKISKHSNIVHENKARHAAAETDYFTCAFKCHCQMKYSNVTTKKAAQLAGSPAHVTSNGSENENWLGLVVHSV